MRVNADADVPHHRAQYFNVFRAERFAAGLAAKRHQTREFPAHDHRNNQFDVLAGHFFNIVEEEIQPLVFRKLAFFVDRKRALAGIQKSFAHAFVKRELDFVIFAEAPRGETVCPLEVRRAFEYGAASDRERAQHQMQRGADHLDEVAAISDLLTKIGERAERVNKFLGVWFHVKN